MLNLVYIVFGTSKLSADLLVQEYGRNFGLKTVSFRAGCLTTSAYGFRVAWFFILSCKNHN